MQKRGFFSDLFSHLETAGTASPNDVRLDDVQAFVDRIRREPNAAPLLQAGAAAFEQAGKIPYALDCLLQLERIGDLDPPGLNKVASLLLIEGERDLARIYLRRAIELDDGAVVDYALSFAATATSREEAREAALLLLSRRHRFAALESYSYQLAATLAQAGRRQAALRVAWWHYAQAPHATHVRVFLASQLAASGEHRQARTLLSDLSGDPAALGLLASIDQAAGAHEEALRSIDAALAILPADHGLMVQRSSILASMHRYREAAEDIKVALEAESATHDTKRLAFAVFTEAGEYEAATSLGGELLSLFPGDLQLGATLKVVLERRERLAALARADRRFGDGIQPAPPPVQHVQDRSLGGRMFAVQLRVLIALILRETRTRFGRSRYGYFWVLFEPLAHIGIMITLITLLGHAKQPPIGDNYAIFYFTGIIPYHMFSHTVGHMMRAVPENRPLLQLSRVKVFDVFMARGVLELLTELLVAGVLMIGFAAFGLLTQPSNPVGVAMALLILWLTAYGVGLLFAVISAYIAGWERIWGAIASLLYFSSGTFYIPRMMPDWIRDILAWNPILQAIELVRSSYFFIPYPYWLSVDYMLCVAVGVCAFGLIMQRIFRRKLLEVE